MNKILLILTLFSIPALSAYAFEDKISVAVTSNYVFRGITQTNDKAAVHPAYQISQSGDLGFYAGIFASNVAKGSEVDIYGGYSFGFGSNAAFILDIGAIEYLYTDTDFAPVSHDSYIGLQYDKSYIKYYFGEENALYLDIGTGTGFNLFGSIDLLLHFGEVFETSQNGNDYSVTLQKDFEAVRIGLTATHEDKTAVEESKLFAYISTGF